MFDLDPNYLNQSGMEIDGIWATEHEIFAAAALLNSKIFIYTVHGYGWKWIEFKPTNNNYDQGKESLYIEHKSQNHYEPVLAM